MKLKIVLLSFGVFFVTVESIRPYTTPSPFGSYRLKQIKCSCNDVFLKYAHKNYTCYTKALSRDVTTVNAYAMVKKQVDKAWAKTTIEYKYGTIYRTVMEFQKVEVCENFRKMKDSMNPATKALYAYIVMLSKEYDTLQRVLKDGCPFKVGEEFSAYNLTVDTRHMPSIINQGDYRATIRVFLENPDNLVCNDTVILSITSPIKESFGRK